MTIKTRLAHLAKALVSGAGSGIMFGGAIIAGIVSWAHYVSAVSGNECINYTAKINGSDVTTTEEKECADEPVAEKTE